MGINYEYLSRIRPLNEEEPSTMPELGRMPSNAGNVEDFNDANSDLSQNTAGLLNSMRMQREVEKREKATPLSEKLFRIEMANRQARQKAAMYIKERELNLKEEEMQYNKVKDAAALARAEADKEELRAKEKAKAELDYNSGYMKFLQDSGLNPSPEARAQYDSIMKPDQTVQSVQTPQDQSVQPHKKTMGQQLGFWKDKEREKALKTSNLKLQEDTGYVFTPEEEQLSEEEKRNILLQKKSQGGSKDPKEFQANSAIYADRIKESNQILDTLESQGYNRADLSNSLVSGVTNSIPLGIGEALKPEQLKMYEQAKRNFINAVLRKESGAVITDEEIKEADKQYFPVVGDTSKVIEQKRRNRQIAYEGIQRASGRQPDQKQDEQPKSSGITREQAIAELKRRGRI